MITFKLFLEDVIQFPQKGILRQMRPVKVGLAGKVLKFKSNQTTNTKLVDRLKNSLDSIKPNNSKTTVFDYHSVNGWFNKHIKDHGFDDGSSITTDKAYSHYFYDAVNNNKHPLPKKAFDKHMNKMGIVSQHIAGKKRYIGISLPKQ